MIDTTRSDGPASETLMVFPSDLGWFALLATEETVRQLSFGYPTARAASHGIRCGKPASSPVNDWQRSVVQLLQAYARGQPTDLCHIRVDPGDLPPFWGKVVRLCRQIPYGRTISYGELAAKARSPRAARAVGNCMAANRIPLLIPCHRVIAASGAPGPYSALGGPSTKRHLLAMEAQGLLVGKLG